MARDQLAVVSDQAWDGPSELRHAGRNLRNLGLAMDLCVLGIGPQLLDRPDLDLARRKDKIHGVDNSQGRGDAYRSAPQNEGVSAIAVLGKQKRPRGLSSGRNSSMIKGYVKGARKVNPKCESESHYLSSPDPAETTRRHRSIFVLIGEPPGFTCGGGFLDQEWIFDKNRWIPAGFSTKIVKSTLI